MENPEVNLRDLVYEIMLDTIIAVRDAEKAGLTVYASRWSDRGLANNHAGVYLDEKCNELLANVRSPDGIRCAVSVVARMRRLQEIDRVSADNEALKKALLGIPPAWDVVAIIKYCESCGVDIASHIVRGSLYEWVSSWFESDEHRPEFIRK